MMKRSISEYLYLMYCKTRTLLFYPSARLIRFPFDVRGKNGIDLGVSLTTGPFCRIESFSKDRKKSLVFGKNVQINDFVHINALNHVYIGDNVLIASKVFITDLAHGSYVGNDFDSDPDIKPIDRVLSSKDVNILDNVWIGENVSILPGVTIGKGSIIGSNSVVTKSIPERSIAVGNPAVVIKIYNKTTKHWERI